jgi:hypothetical protein
MFFVIAVPLRVEWKLGEKHILLQKKATGRSLCVAHQNRARHMAAGREWRK